ncbi:hypothetical protein SERLA73DRAFT_153113 [Serpula lacrymans var. lacrymans S7.3]|uniref:HTH CENPB-type domain-containing protein n=1 Tax=Serpula lacrymans var. lacrymans (strain S7.3) TaxID=936435 RepID=F8Q0K6_SERL3|nr:hypothetical protein SERLA73DRAFT_153113 [Serpula lacrymans var. lacrymans S7.3]
MIEKCKPCEKPAQHTQPAKRQKVDKDLPATSAQPVKNTSRHNLTLSDWSTVYTYIEVDKSALLFNQSTLSRKLHKHPKMENCINNNPSALSSKRPCIVTNSEVECAIILWVKHLESKGDTITGAILQQKWRRFEDKFKVPQKERLGEGWVQFCKAYKIREIQRHGEAGSVNLEAVVAEQQRCQKVLAKYALRDQFNFDETCKIPIPFAELTEGQVLNQQVASK